MKTTKTLYEDINKIVVDDDDDDVLDEAVDRRKKIQATQKKINALVKKALTEYAKVADEGEGATGAVVRDLTMRISETIHDTMGV